MKLIKNTDTILYFFKTNGGRLMVDIDDLIRFFNPEGFGGNDSEAICNWVINTLKQLKEEASDQDPIN